MELKDKVAVVSGASGGLGWAISRLLLERGVMVFGLARSAEKLAQLSSAYDGFRGIVCDITDEEAVARAASIVQAVTPRVDILINNAGLGRFGPIDQLSSEDWHRQMRTNLDGVYYLTKRFVGPMKQQNVAEGFGGHIVNVASVAGLMGNPNISAYNATKFGLRGMSEALFKELRADGIKVSCIYPGSIETDFFDVAEMPMSKNPMQATDVAATVLHLLEAPDNYLISEVVMRPLRP